MDKAFEIEEGIVAKVPLSLIDADPNQPREDFNEGSLYELADDIKKVGVQQPITLRPQEQAPGRFFIVYGERRYRASKLAKKKTVPALLYTGKQTNKSKEGTSLDVLLNQVKENHLRKDLNPMEWAKTFHVMNKIHGLKQAEIEDTLKSHAVGNFGRAYISNILRLLDLPEWAQLMIRQGKLTAAHGKHMLPAMASDKVMTSLKESFADEAYSPTTKDLQKDIYVAFMREHPDLTSWRTDFDYKEKCVATGCQKMRKISHPDGDESTFCLDRGCCAKFNAEAQAEQEQKEQDQRATRNGGEETAAPKDFIVSDSNEVNIGENQLEMWEDYRPLKGRGISFDKAGCEGCPHRHTAVGTEESDDDSEINEDSCFNLACLDLKQAQANKADDLAIEHAREVVSTRVSINPDLCHKILLWVALNSPEGKQKSIHEDEGEFVRYGCDYMPEEEGLDDILTRHNLCSISDFLDDRHIDDDTIAELAEYYLRNTHRLVVLEIAKRLNISIDSYRINQRWIAEHTTEEIENFIFKLDLPPAVFENLELAEGEDFDNLLLNNADKIGVPPAIRFAYEQLTKEEDED